MGDVALIRWACPGTSCRGAVAGELSTRGVGAPAVELALTGSADDWQAAFPAIEAAGGACGASPPPGPASAGLVQ